MLAAKGLTDTQGIHLTTAVVLVPLLFLKGHGINLINLL